MLRSDSTVPRLYTTAAKIAKEVNEKKVGIKSLVYKPKRVNIKAVYSLVINALKHSKQLDHLLKKSNLLKEHHSNPWLAKILITELLWGKKQLKGETPFIRLILAHEQIFKAHSSDAAEISNNTNTVSLPRYVRVNTILISVNETVEAFRKEGWRLVRYMDSDNYDGFLEKVAFLGPEEFMIDIHIEDLLIFPHGTEFHDHVAYRDGLIFLQDKASCFPVQFLNPKRNSTVLDMCAAPGMKTSQIACRLENEGTIYAVDMNKKRLEALNELMEKHGITCVTTMHQDILNIKDRECPEVEYILVDPSCSGSGIVNRLELTEMKQVDETRLKKLFGFQVMILKHAFRHFPNVKRIVYSTCSLNTTENEKVVEDIITNHNGFKLIDIRELMPNWQNFGSEEFGEIGRRCLYSRPDKDLTTGFFIAVFEKLGDNEVNEFFKPYKMRDSTQVYGNNKNEHKKNQIKKVDMDKFSQKNKNTNNNNKHNFSEANANTFNITDERYKPEKLLQNHNKKENANEGSCKASKRKKKKNQVNANTSDIELKHNIDTKLLENNAQQSIKSTKNKRFSNEEVLKDHKNSKETIRGDSKLNENNFANNEGEYVKQGSDNEVNEFFKPNKMKENNQVYQNNKNDPKKVSMDNFSQKKKNAKNKNKHNVSETNASMCNFTEQRDKPEKQLQDPNKNENAKKGICNTSKHKKKKIEVNANTSDIELNHNIDTKLLENNTQQSIKWGTNKRSSNEEVLKNSENPKKRIRSDFESNEDNISNNKGGYVKRRRRRMSQKELLRLEDEKKERRKRLNKENSSIRESLSDFLQTLSSPAIDNGFAENTE